MASKDPLSPLDMRKLYISEARCNSDLLRASKQYRLHFTIQPPATIIGLRSPKSEYIEATHDTVVWKDPFGDEFTVTPTPAGCTVVIDVLEGRFGRSGRLVASCSLDLSSAIDKEIRLDLKGDANAKLGELTLCVASSLASTGGAVQNANQAAQQLGPGLAMVNDAIQATAPLVTEITGQLNAWQPLLSRLGALVKVADLLAEAHPWIKLAWGIVSAAYKIASAQSDRDAKVMGLVQTMADSCSFADEAEELKKRSERDQDIINQILRQVMECAYFIRDYSKNKSFAKRTVKYTISLVDARIDNYKGSLETLRRNLIEHANIQCSVITHRVLDVVTEVRDLQVLSEVRYAPEAHHDLDKGCLPGTRGETIDAIVRWALGADTPSSDPSNSITLSSKESSRVLWLCGMAGAGKSTILRSCAKRVSELERKGAYYGFDKNKPLANMTNLFSTIARDLAELDDSRKQRLIDAVKRDVAIRTTDNCKLQFQHFIIASFEGDKAVGETIVFIDAFDESGDAMVRADALAILTKQASKLPPGLRVIVTSRYERDIQDALRSPLPPGVDVMLVDDIPKHQTLRDIATYMHSELRDMDELQEAEYQTQLNTLIRKAGTSFQWAATACRFICSIDAGVDPRERIETVLSADAGLYPLYSTVMKEHCNPSDKRALERVKSILGRIICAQEPLSLHALVHLVPPDSIAMSDRIQQQIVKGLASVLSGTHSDDGPIAPLHSSYRDFLCNAEHSKDFYIDEGEANERMALACFRVMDQTLTFNICQIPTSFLRNVDMPNIKGLREKHIPHHLHYACRFWGFHVSATPSGEFAQKPMGSFFQKDFLPWLEVMSLTQSSPQTALASLGTFHIPVDLIGLQRDAVQFISMFATAIAASMPHIYLSSFTFAPTSSLLYQKWQGQFPGVATLTQGQLQDWPKIMLILEGHHDAVLSVAFSPDGKQIASSSSDKTIQLWSVEMGERIGQPMGGHEDAILSISFSPDGKCIASGSQDKTIRLWNVDTCASIGQPMKGHDNGILSIAFSPDGKLIASGSRDKTIRFWNVKTGASIGHPISHNHTIRTVAFSPDGKCIASGSSDNTIQLWNVKTRASIGQPMGGHNDAIQTLSFSPNGKQIASGSWDKTIRLWNVETGASIGQPMKGHDAVLSVAFSPNGKQIASCSLGKNIQLWSVETASAIGQPMEGHHDAVLSVAFSPDGKQIVSGSRDKTVRVWSVEMGASIGQPTERHGDGIWSVAFSPDGRQIVSGSLDKTIQLWNVETGTRIGQPMEGHDDAVLSVAFSPDGSQIASASKDKTIQLWSVEMGVRIGQKLEGHSDAVLSVAFSPDGHQIASGSLDKTIQLWDVETGGRIGQPMEGHDNGICSVAFSPDGKQLASGSLDKAIQLWDVEMGVRIGYPMEGHHGGIRSIAFSPDGRQIASGSEDKTIQLWNVERGERIGQPMEGHSQDICSITFSPDGKLIASCSEDKTIQLWDVDTGKRIGQPMEGHTAWILSIAFSPDGKHIASGSLDKTIRVWNVETVSSIGHNSAPNISQLPTAKSKHTLQYPVHLFPLPPSPFRLDDGWILGPNNELILWVPAAYRASLEHPHCRIMGNPNNTQIDFQHLKCGKEWVECRRELVGK